MIESLSATIFSALTGIVIIFQACLAAGVPWGQASMGGRYPGKYPPKMRAVAILNMIILALMAAVVLSEAKLMFPQLNAISGVAIWIVVVFFVFGTIMNSITPSKIERIWSPIALMQLITSLVIAIN